MPSHRSVAVIVPPRESRHGDHPRKGIGRHDVGAAGLAPRHGGFVLVLVLALVDGAADAGARSLPADVRQKERGAMCAQVLCHVECAGRDQELAQRKVIAARAREIAGANHRRRDGAPGDRHTEALVSG
jgi:hypothetical protein